MRELTKLEQQLSASQEQQREQLSEQSKQSRSRHGLRIVRLIFKFALGLLLLLLGLLPFLKQYEMTEIKGNSPDVNIEAMKRVYFSDSLLTSEQSANVRHLENSMDRFKIFNPYARIAILGIVGKECNFKVGSEISYRNTPNDRIRMVFGSRLSNYNDAQLTVLKKDDYDFFNAVYGGMYQNDTTEGYKYRGRGFNQITFKANYDTIAKIIGVDIVANPDLMMDAKIAADATVAYFINRWKTKPADVPQLADLRNIDDATLYLFKANAGWGKNIDTTFHKQTLEKVRNWSENFTYIN